KVLSTVVVCSTFPRATFVVSQILSRLLLRRLKDLKIIYIRPSSLFSLSRISSRLRDFDTFKTIFQSLIHLSHICFDFILSKFFKNYFLKFNKEEFLISSLLSL